MVLNEPSLQSTPLAALNWDGDPAQWSRRADVGGNACRMSGRAAFTADHCDLTAEVGGNGLRAIHSRTSLGPPTRRADRRRDRRSRSEVGVPREGIPSPSRSPALQEAPHVMRIPHRGIHRGILVSRPARPAPSFAHASHTIGHPGHRILHLRGGWATPVHPISRDSAHPGDTSFHGPSDLRPPSVHRPCSGVIGIKKLRGGPAAVKNGPCRSTE